MKALALLGGFLSLALVAWAGLAGMFGSATEEQLAVLVTFDTTFNQYQSTKPFKDRLRELIARERPETVTRIDDGDFEELIAERKPPKKARTSQARTSLSPPTPSTEPVAEAPSGEGAAGQGWEEVFKNEDKDDKGYEGDEWMKAFGEKGEGKPEEGKPKEGAPGGGDGKEVWPSSTFGEGEFAEDEIWSSLYRKIEEGLAEDKPASGEGAAKPVPQDKEPPAGEFNEYQHQVGTEDEW
ncbi:MAG: hypothetical protein A2284_04340 [Deltaproteobacteria bacterium RIFOXYA12_FULL_61_11]|nr:MAG: hypothetical protein A2284_04340 [Deltaproteobacteria bacterium RIFOXYA12_FULL_61_11]